LPLELDQLLGTLLARRPERRPEAGAVLNAKLGAALDNPLLAQLGAPLPAAGRASANELTADSGVWTSGSARVAS
jgi:hypothetical protein